LVLPQRVAKEVGVRTKLADSMIPALPPDNCGLDWRILAQKIKDEFSAIPLAGSADLPIVRHHSFFEIRASQAEILGVKNRLQW